MRYDFAIHDDGSIVSKYINLGSGQEPKLDLGPRTDFFKLWTLAMGRKPKHNETMDPRQIVNVEFLVKVGDKEHGGDGELYSRVESFRREPVAHEALSSSLNSSSLDHSSLNTQLLNTQPTQAPSSTQATQVPSSSSSGGIEDQTHDTSQRSDGAKAPLPISAPPSPTDRERHDRLNRMRSSQGKPLLSWEDFQRDYCKAA